MNIEDLLAEESFLNGLKQGKPELSAELKQFIQENPQKDFLPQQALDYYQELFKQLAEADVENEENRLRAVALSENQPVQIKPVLEIKHPKRRVKGWLFRAAVVLIVLTAGWYFITGENKGNNLAAHNSAESSFVVQNGEKKKLELPDGTIVTLNSGSSMNIEREFGTLNRKVTLAGEAFFEVKHNAQIPFIVHCPNMDIKALGTAFNVKAYDGDGVTTTALVKGKVEVTLLKCDHRKVILHPNQKIEWREYGETLKSLEDQAPGINLSNIAKMVKPLTTTIGGDTKETAWVYDQLVFDDERLEKIALLLERWYGVKVVFAANEIKDYRFTGSFEKENIETVLNFLKESREFTFEITNDKLRTVKLY